MAKVIYVPKWILPFGYGLTIYKLVLVRKDSKDIDYVREHELVHVQQWTKLGLFRFPYEYIKEFIKNGYNDNVFEKQARELGYRRSKK